MQRERRQLPLAFLLSLLLHALLLSLIFHGGQGFGLPSFALPWQQRWIEVADLHVVLQPAPPAAAAPMPAPAAVPEPAASEAVVAAGPASTPSGSFAASLRLRAQPVVSDAAAKTEAKKGSGVPRRAVAAKATLPARETRQAAPAPSPRTAVIALEQSDDKTFVVPPQPTEPTSDAIVAAQDSLLPAPEDAVETLPEQTEAAVLEQTAELTEATSTENEAQRLVQLETARQETERRETEQLAAEKREVQQQETARQEAVRAEAERKEAERLAAEKQEAQRREAARQEAARAEAARQEVERREAERLAAEKLEAQRREAARQETARTEAARREVERREAERLAAEKLEAQRREAARQEAARAEAARQEVERREAERLAAEKLEAQRREAARQEAAHTEAERLAAEKLEAQRREAARQEAARAEATHQETAHREAERLAAEKQEAQRHEAGRQEAARADAARQDIERREAARAQADREEDERRLARRRAMGRQLDEEAAQRQAAATANRPPLPLSLSTARRARLWGRSDPNVELVLYAEAWMRRIQLNTPVDTVRQVASRRHTAPMVTVAVRSDGYVESVTIVVSSGVAEVDEAIRRIVTNNVPYPPFPAALARQYEVLEIRRTWHFDNTLHLD